MLIGTVVERDKTVEHAIGTAGGAIMPPTKRCAAARRCPANGDGT
jgi:hypothetical protein